MAHNTRSKRHSTANPPERISLSAVSRLRFGGVSALLLPNGSLRCGAEADAALSESRRQAAVEEASARIRGGLLLVHSHRQRAHDFALHARMVALIAKLPPVGYQRKVPFGDHVTTFGNGTNGLAHGQPPSMLRRLSLLIINNDAGRHPGDYSSPEHPVQWLQHYRHVPDMRVRMLILTAVNMGYNCGEFHSLSAASGIIGRFPWVLYVSGPDNLPTPYGVLRLSTLLSQGQYAGHLLADKFIGSIRQISLDLFVYQTAGGGDAEDEGGGQGEGRAPGVAGPRHDNAGAAAAHAFWGGLVERCLTRLSNGSPGNVPEPLLWLHAHESRLNVTGIGSTHNCAGMTKHCLDFEKARALGPLRHSAVWHSHNRSSVTLWLEREERHWAHREAPGGDSYDASGSAVAAGAARAAGAAGAAGPSTAATPTVAAHERCIMMSAPPPSSASGDDEPQDQVNKR
jgi:hypothetical protein